jgi:TrmH family RNA methyltransferase
VVEVFATPEATQRYAELAAAAPAWTLVDERALSSLSDAVTPAGVVAVCRFLDRPLAVVLEPGAGLVAICADVSDPGNAGTVVRCADAAGADAVVLAGRSVDAYNAKTVRASVGSIFHVPLAVEPDTETAVRAAQEAGLLVLAADGAGEVDLFEAEALLPRRTAWLFGSEAHGLSTELSGLADHRVRIPIHGRAESLNLATAAALCLYASARAQR